MVYDFTTKQGIRKFVFLAFKNSSPKAIRINAFLEYLKRIGVKSILIEEKYIDKDYLKDYANYYARCFVSYGHECKRVHFFKSKLDKTHFDRILFDSKKENKLVERIQKSYLGFMVIKPIPTPIGKTCLQIYPESNNRKYPAIRDYSVNLYGISLNVKSLAYQEQDGTVAVCASSALWSAAQKTSSLFQHRLPSPSEITKLSTSQTSFSRNFPNNGLSAEQLGVGISKLGLEPQIYQTLDSRFSKMIIYAYLKAGIPVIAGVSLFEMQEKDKKINLKLYGEHAVTIAGYSFEDGEKEISISNEIILKSSSLTKIFCHDDQLCPFARMKFDKKFYKNGDSATNQMLDTSWKSLESDLPIIARMDTIIVPLYNKVRISILTIFGIINALEIQFQGMYEKVNEILEGKLKIKNAPISWDIHLSDVNTLKKELVAVSPSEIESNKVEILKHPLPKYMWRATAFIGSKKEFEILFDATDIEQGKIYLSRVDYASELINLIRVIKTLISVKKQLAEGNSHNRRSLIVYSILKDI